MPIPKLKYEIDPDMLAEFANNHATPYFELCIMIENITAVEYHPFYSTIRKDFRKVFHGGETLDTVSTTRMYEAYNGFDDSIKDFFDKADLSGAKAVEMVGMPALTLDQCRKKFDSLWHLENYVK